MMLTLALGAALFAPLPQDTTVPVPAGTRLELSARTGSITVRTWSRSAIQVSGDNGSGAALAVRVTVSGGVARVGPERGRGRHGSPEDYRLTVPAWMDLELSTTEGDIAVTGSEGRLRISSVEGNVSIRGGREFVSVTSVEGEVLVDGARGRVETSSVDGGITIRNTDGVIVASTVDGDITMESIVSGDVDATTVDGSISLRGRVSPTGRYRLNSHDGDITLELPGLDAMVTVSTFDGEFSTCGYPATVVPSGDRPSRKRFSFKVGTGQGRVDLESFDGSIFLVKTGCR